MKPVLVCCLMTLVGACTKLGGIGSNHLADSQNPIHTDKASYAVAEPMLVTFVGITPNTPGDRVGITLAVFGSDDAALVDEQDLGSDETTGTRLFTTTLTPGTIYVARAVEFGEQTTTLAETTIPFFEYNIDADQKDYVAGDEIVLFYSGMAGTPTDWVAISEVNSPDASYVQWQYTTGTQVGAATFNTPLPAGAYVSRAYFSNGSVKQYEGPVFYVEPPDTAPTVTTDHFAYGSGDPIPVSFANMLGNPTDWISIAVSGSTDNSYVAWRYSGGSRSGSLLFTNRLAAGTYVARAFYANGSVKQAESLPFTIGDVSTLPTLVTDSDHYGSGQAVAVGFSNMLGSAGDWIGISVVGSPDPSYVVWQSTNGAQNGSIAFATPLGPGAYVARAYFANGSIKQAESPTFTVSAPLVPASVTTDKTSYASTDPIVVSFANLLGNPSDWVAIAPAGSSDTSYAAWKYTAGVKSGSLVFTTPLSPGDYVARVYFANTSGRQAETAAFTVLPPLMHPTIGTDQSSYDSGTPIVVTFTSMLGNPTDWIAISLEGSADTSYVEWQYTNGVAAGAITFSAALPAGNYVARAFFSNANTKQAESLTFTVNPQTTAPVILAGDPVHLFPYQFFPTGGTIYAFLQDMLGNPTDWIAISKVGALDSYVAWRYTGGVKNAFLNTNPGPLPFTTPIPPGEYVLQAFFANSNLAQARSAPFVVYQAGPPPTVTVNQPTYFQGTSVIVSYSNMLGSPTDWIALAAKDSPDTSYVAWQYTGGAKSGTLTFTAPSTFGTYVSRAFFANTPIKSAESTIFTVPCLDDGSCPASTPFCDGVACTASRAGAACSVDADCTSGHCAGSLCCPTACGACGTCASGTCLPTQHTPSLCFPYLCDGLRTDCSISCQNSLGCSSGNSCQSGVCVPITTSVSGCLSDSECSASTPFCTRGQCGATRGIGAICQAATDCGSGYCSDGFCCDQSCAGSCDSCAKSLGAVADGYCTNVPGAGNPACGDYRCTGSTPACPTACSSDTDCVSGDYCNSGQCVPICNGSNCNCGISEHYSAVTSTCLPLQQCNADIDCASPNLGKCEVAENAACRQQKCVYLSSCNPDEVCQSGTCVAAAPAVASYAPAYPAGGAIVIRFARLSGSPGETIVIAPDGSPDSTVVASLSTKSLTAGFLSFVDIPNGTFRARAFAGGSVHTAESEPFVVGDSLIVRDQFAIVLKSTADGNAAATDLTQKFSLSEVTVLPALNILTAVVPSDQLALLIQDSQVAFVDQNRLGEFSQSSLFPCQRGTDSNNKVPQRASTGLRRIGGSVDGHHQTLVNKGNMVGVAVLDTGVYPKHPDLEPNLEVGTSVVSASSDDLQGHGTAVAGIIAAADNDFGVVGVAPLARIYPVKLSDSGAITSVAALAALEWVRAHNLSDPQHLISVVNMSWGFRRKKTPLTTADSPTVPPRDICVNADNDAIHTSICRLYNSGVTLVTGSGNIGPSNPNRLIDDPSTGTFDSPAFYSEVIAVSGLTDSDGFPGGLDRTATYPDCPADNRPAPTTDDEYWQASVSGPQVVVAAPAACLRTTRAGGGYCPLSGTSASAPLVSGAAALYLSAHPGASPLDVRNALLNTTDGEGVLKAPYSESVLRLSRPVVYTVETTGTSVWTTANFISQIDTEDNSLTRIASLPIGGGELLVVSPKQNELAVLSYPGFGQRVAFMNLATNPASVIRTWDPPNPVNSLTYDAEGTRFYTISQASCQSTTCPVIFETYDAATGSLISSVIFGNASIGGTSHGATSLEVAVAFHPDGERVYLGDELSTTPAYLTGIASTVGEFDISTGVRLSTLVGSSPDSQVNSLAISPDGSVLYVAQGSSNPLTGRIDILDTRTHVVVSSTAVTQPLDMRLSPDGGLLAATSTFWGAIYWMNSDGSELTVDNFHHTWDLQGILNSKGRTFYTAGADFEGGSHPPDHNFFAVELSPFAKIVSQIPDVTALSIHHSAQLAVGQKPLF